MNRAQKGSGLYFYVIRAGAFRDTQRMILQK